MSSEQQTKSTVGFHPNENIAVLLDFQDKFLGLVHSQLYSQREPIDDAIVKFQISHLTDVNNAWKGMVDQLTFTLIKQRVQYDNQLRDYFHKALNLDYLPLLRINRHQVTQLSLYGFDIYIDPLSALLEIINRIDGLKTIVAQGAPSKQTEDIKERPDDIWEAIKKGWTEYMFEAALYKVGFNIYILKEYLKIGAKSLVKKDKEIVFTGCGNLFSDFVPLLKQSKQIWLLVELSTLANQLYNFHPSFNYSHFYSLMLPLNKDYEPVFRAIGAIGAKCLNTNILTPLLFAILRHRQVFVKFIEQANDECWGDYLNSLAFGLILNFKTRILEYQEALSLLQLTISKLGVLGQLDTSYFAGQLGKEWSEARDFFISALKVGYNVGELQTWHPTDHTLIQPKILEYTASALFMLPELPDKQTLSLYLETNGDVPASKIMLQKSLQRLSGNRISRSQFTQTGFNPKIIDQIAMDLNQIETEKKEKVSLQATREEILRLGNLIEYLELTDNAFVLSYMLSFVSKLSYCQHGDSVLQRRVRQTGQKLCSLSIIKLQKQKHEELSEILYEFNLKFPNDKFIKDLVQLELTISSTKNALARIFKLAEQSQSLELAKWVASNILTLYCSETLSNPRTLKTFEKQYVIDIQVTHLRSRMHSSVAFLAQKIMWDKSTFAMEILMWIPRLCPWTTIPLLSFPVSFVYDKSQEDNKLESFSLWFIQNPEHHHLLLTLLRQGLLNTSKQIQTFCREISVPSVCEQVIHQINKNLRELEDVYDSQKYKTIILLLDLLRKSMSCYGRPIEAMSGPASSLYRKMLQIFNKALEKLDESVTGYEEYLGLIVESLSQFYPSLINIIYEKPFEGRGWRQYMRKICLISLDIATDTSFGLEKEVTLPSIKNDSTFLIQNSTDYFKEEEHHSLSLTEPVQQRALKYFTAEAKVPTAVQEAITPILLHEIRDFKLDQNSDAYLAKQYLLPSISSKMLGKLVEKAGENRALMVDLLAMTPTNHNRIFTWAINNKDKQLLKVLGFSKQTAISHLPSLLGLAESQLMAELVSCLDQQSCRSIGDSFSMDNLTSKSPSDPENKEMENLIQNFSSSLGFLLIFNQSNWRYLMEWAFAYGGRLALNTPSIILQYLEYHRITANVSQDYEKKVEKYSQFLTLISQLMGSKFEYIQSLWHQCHERSVLASHSSPAGSMLSGGSSVTPKIRNNAESITEEEIELFQVNELGNIKLFCEASNLRDVLFRSANFQRELGLTADFNKKYQPIHDILSSIATSAQTINHIANSLAGGNLIAPDFSHHFQLCSKAALYDYKIHVGQILEEYFEEIGRKEHYVYYPVKETVMPVEQYIKSYINSLESPPSGVGVTFEENSKKPVAQKYEELKQNLLDDKVICFNEETKTIDTSFKVTHFESDHEAIEEANQSGKEPQDLTAQQENALFYLGCLLKILKNWEQGDNLAPLFDHSLKRTKIGWEILRADWPEIYHYIKATLIDDEIASRKLNFVFKNKPLLPEGEFMTVNSGNKLWYCSLVGRACLHANAWKSGSALAMGGGVPGS